jgi:hypothetical protein
MSSFVDCDALFPEISDVKICGPNKRTCYDSAKNELLEQDIAQEFAKSNKTSCNCLPSCFSNSYEAEISSTDLEFESYWEAILLKPIAPPQ